MEIWNLVFMQEQVDGDLRGRGAAAGQERRHRFLPRAGGDGPAGRRQRTSRPTCSARPSRRPSGCSGKRHGEDPHDDVSLKIVAEHGRATTFLIADGVQPSNEGRGYILRRMLRRVVSHARRLGIEGSVLDPIITTVIDGFGDAYPELRENEAFVRQVADSEEERFSATLGQGLVLFEEAKGRAEGRAISGDDAFKLSDTFGFPREQIQEWAAEAGLTVDMDRFAELLAGAARPRARGAQEGRGRSRSRRRAAHRVRRLPRDPRPRRPIALVLDDGPRTARGRGGGPGRARVPRPHAVLRRGRRSGRRPGPDPHRHRRGPRGSTPCRPAAHAIDARRHRRVR